MNQLSIYSHFLLVDIMVFYLLLVLFSADSVACDMSSKNDTEDELREEELLLEPPSETL